MARYEAGVLSAVVPRLVEEGDDKIVLVGTSAGVINTAILAAFEHPNQAVAEMIELWTTVDVGNIFSSIFLTVPQLPLRYLTDVTHLPGRLDSLLDSRPLAATMEHRLDWNQLDRNLRSGGWVHAAGIIATSCARGQCVAFVQGKGLNLPQRGSTNIDYARTKLGTQHVLASAVIPVAFRPVQIDTPTSQRGWYVDGGVKLNAPIKPAIDLGADRVVIVATTPDPAMQKPGSLALDEPDIFDASAVLMHAMLVDRMADDIRALRRVNTLVSAARANAPGGYRKIPSVYFGPPEPGLIAETANRIFARRYGGIHRPWSNLGLLGRLLGGTRQTRGELLSFVFFDREFHQALIELGRAHATHTIESSDHKIPWN